MDVASAGNSSLPVIWLTGLSGAGKTTLAKALTERINDAGFVAVTVDGDVLRAGLCSDLGFDLASRTENVRRAAEVARLMHQAGLVVLVALISPLRRDRLVARTKFGSGLFIEVHVDADIQTLVSRDTKGLYARARLGKLDDLTGVSSIYEAPEHPEVRVDTAAMSIDEAAEAIFARVRPVLGMTGSAYGNELRRA